MSWWLLRLAMAATGSTDDGAAAEAGEEDAAAAGAESEVRRYKAFKVMLMDCGCRPLPARPLKDLRRTNMTGSTIGPAFSDGKSERAWRRRATA